MQEKLTQHCKSTILQQKNKQTKTPKGPRRSAREGTTPTPAPPFLCLSIWLPFPEASVLSGSCRYVCINSCVYTYIQYVSVTIHGCTFKCMPASVYVYYSPTLLYRGWQAQMLVHTWIFHLNPFWNSVCMSKLRASSLFLCCYGLFTSPLLIDTQTVSDLFWDRK